MIAVCDSLGQIYIYNREGSPLELLTTLKVETGQQVRGIARSSNENYLIAGSSDGSITVFEMNQPGKERLAKEYVSFMGRAGVRLV